MAVVRGNLSSVAGYPDVMRRLQQLANPTLAKKYARKASRLAMTPMYKEARLNMRMLDDPTTKEKIWRNMSLRNRKTTKDTVGTRLGVRGGAKEYKGGGLVGGDTFYWRFLEFGTKKIRARSPMRRAFQHNVKGAEKEFAVEFRKQLMAGVIR